jgi:hypothetical protein
MLTGVDQQSGERLDDVRTRLDFALVPAMAATTSGQDAHHAP